MCIRDRSVIAGLVLGEFSVSSGWFNSEIMLAMAFVSVANYTQPNFELGYALKFMRLQLLILTAILNLSLIHILFPADQPCRAWSISQDNGHAAGCTECSGDAVFYDDGVVE